MSVMLGSGGKVLLGPGGKVATDPDCCCGGSITCCVEGSITLPLINMNYEAVISGHSVVAPCMTDYTVSASSGSLDNDLSNLACSGGNYIRGVQNATFDFDTSPMGAFSPNCFAQYSLIVECLQSVGHWVLSGAVSSSSSSGDCEALCGGAFFILWGGGTGELNLGSDPRGTHLITFTDLIIPTIAWSFNVVIT